MKKKFKLSFLSFMIVFLGLPKDLFCQNVGIGITTPGGKLHIKGSADTSQLILMLSVPKVTMRLLSSCVITSAPTFSGSIRIICD